MERKPFINWVGGKRKIAKILASYIPEGLNNYYEPFLGGGALFFLIYHKFNQCFLSDINLELVTAYNALKHNADRVAYLLNQHEDSHCKEYFYRLRDNNRTNDPNLISARFIYLNRYCYRGIYKINKNGNSAITFSPDTYINKISPAIIESSRALAKASIYANDFTFIEATPRDFVYFDPPYHQAAKGLYTKLEFDESDQIRLRDFVLELSKKNIKVMISNSDTSFIRDLYKEFNLNEIDRTYDIRTHKKISKELIITNYDIENKS